MYKAKRFQIRKTEDVLRDLEEVGNTYPGVRRIFLADGDALAADTEDLLRILSSAYRPFPLLRTGDKLRESGKHFKKAGRGPGKTSSGGDLRRSCGDGVTLQT